jgi:Flp pilus assembly protein TadD
LKESVEKLPKNPVPHYHLGMAYLKNGQEDLAKLQLTKALSLDGSFPGAEEAREALKKL